MQGSHHLVSQSVSHRHFALATALSIQPLVSHHTSPASTYHHRSSSSPHPSSTSSTSSPHNQSPPRCAITLPTSQRTHHYTPPLTPSLAPSHSLAHHPIFQTSLQLPLSQTPVPGRPISSGCVLSTQLRVSVQLCPPEASERVYICGGGILASSCWCRNIQGGDS